MNKKSNIKTVKVFLNDMNSWFSNFIIELLRTDHNLDAKLKYEFSGTVNSISQYEMRPLPKYFQPNIIQFDYNTSYQSELFQNDIFIYNLNNGDIKEIDYIMKGLRSIRLDNDKTVILISNIMTWAKTPTKYKLNEDEEGECYVPPLDDNEIKEPEEQKDNEIEPNEEDDNDVTNNNYNNNNDITNENKSVTIKSNFGVNVSKIHSQKSNIFKKKNKTDQYKDKDWFEERTISDTNINNKQIMFYTESEYTKRIPHQNYIHFKYIENQLLALGAHKENVKAYVVCPGFIYGYGEDFFFDLYKQFFIYDDAITSQNPLITALLSGRNTIPTIHIKDLVSLIKRIIDRKPQNKYILAVDHTKNPQIKNIVKCIKACVAKQTVSTANKEQEHQEEAEQQQQPQQQEEEPPKEEQIMNDMNTNIEDINNNNELEQGDDNSLLLNQQQQQTEIQYNFKYEPIQNFSEMNIDLKLKPSNVFIDEKREDEDKEDYEKRSFKWHCQYGIPENISQLRKEFMKYRGLKSNKIFIIGTPYTGKTTLSSILSKNFNLNTLKLNEAIQLIKATSTNVELLTEIQSKLTELESTLQEAEDAYNKRPNKKKTDPPFDPNQHMKLPTYLVTKILNERLNAGDTYLNGFIFDGYPRTYEEASQLFTEAFEDKDKVLSSSIIIFDDVEDEYVINRVKQSEEYVKEYSKEPNPFMDRVNRRLSNVKLLKEQEDYKPLMQYFEENEIKVLKVNCKDSIRDIVKQCMEFIVNNNEGQRNVNGVRMGYVSEVYDYESECVQKEQEEERMRLEEEERKRKEEEEANKGIEQQIEQNEEKSEIKEENEQQQQQDTVTAAVVVEHEAPKTKTKEEIHKEREFKLLERKTEVLRRYISDNVMPLLSLGILRIAEERPNDPVEALANFLLENTFESNKIDAQEIQKAEHVNDEHTEEQEDEKQQQEINIKNEQVPINNENMNNNENV